MTRIDVSLAREFAALKQETTSWQDQLNIAERRFSQAHHGDYERWTAHLEAALNTDEVAARKEALQGLRPWRKGPWDIGGVQIETEWRSDWKWDRLAQHLPQLDGGRVLDIGCGNGYFGWRLLQHGARCVVGVDPTLLFCMQHLVTKELLQPDAPNWVIPLRGEELNAQETFDCVLSMGVIYHRKDPQQHVNQLAELAAPGATIVLESLVVEQERSLVPAGRYARMRNVSIVPTPQMMVRWMEGAGLSNPQIVDITPTTTAEQRSTDWMTFESLSESLDPTDSGRTVEGHPAPVRAIVLAQRP